MPQEQFTREDVEQAIGALDADSQALVLGALDSMVVSRQEARMSERLRMTTVDFLKVYRRCNDKNASDSNLEGWHEDMFEFSMVYLGVTTDMQMQDDPDVVPLRNLAAVVHGVMGLQLHRDLPDVLELFGVSDDEFVGLVKPNLSAIYSQRGREPLEGLLEMNTEEFIAKHRYWMHEWAPIVDPYAEAAFATADRLGIEIPELNEEGLLPEEAEDY